MHILHVDMDAFFASIEQRDNPDLKGKPVIVGGSDPAKRGVVSTASYEARKYGVRSAMPLREAYRLCPDGIFVAGDHSRYKKEAARIREIFFEFSPRVEVVSIDEAFIDVSGCELLFGEAPEIARKIKKRIKNVTGLTASVGVAGNKFLAKLASDLNKPDGLTVISKEDIPQKVWPLPVNRLFGVGEKTEKILQKRGIKTIGCLARLEPHTVKNILGRAGLELYRLAHGIDDRKVTGPDVIKSIGHEITFQEDIISNRVLETKLLTLSEKVGKRLREECYKARTVQLKLRFSDFKTISRRKTLKYPTLLTREIYENARDLLHGLGKLKKGVRLIGVSVSNFVPDNFTQLSLFNPEQKKEEQLEKVVDQIKGRFGDEMLTRAKILED